VEGANVTVALNWTPLFGTVDFSNGTITLHLSITCKNEGKSAGWISRIRLEAGIFQNTIPNDPNFDNASVMWNGVEKVSPQEEFKQYDSYVLREKQDSITDWILIWGRVEYSDTLSDKRQTTFGYILSVDYRSFDPIQMPAYNKRL